jgi:hypothetical protein
MLRRRILNRRNVTGVRGDASNLATVAVLVVHRTTAALKSLDPRRLDAQPVSLVPVSPLGVVVPGWRDGKRRVMRVRARAVLEWEAP